MVQQGRRRVGDDDAVADGHQRHLALVVRGGPAGAVLRLGVGRDQLLLPQGAQQLKGAAQRVVALDAAALAADRAVDEIGPGGPDVRLGDEGQGAAAVAGEHPAVGVRAERGDGPGGLQVALEGAGGVVDGEAGAVQQLGVAPHRRVVGEGRHAVVAAVLFGQRQVPGAELVAERQLLDQRGEVGEDPAVDEQGGVDVVDVDQSKIMKYPKLNTNRIMKTIAIIQPEEKK